MVKRTVPVGASKGAMKRLRRCSLLSRAFRAGDASAAFSLTRRHRAYLSLSVGMPWQERLALANAARARNKAARLEAKTKADSLRPYMESTRDL